MTEKKQDLIAVVRIKGPVGIRKDIADTLDMLRLKRINNCVLVSRNPTIIGMLKKADRCITWGEISKETEKKLIEKRGEGKENKVFRLSPASKGLKSTKQPFPKGDLGYRGEKINELLERMI